mgnify:CR=1 FL=1
MIHSFDDTVAQLVGVDEAILFYHIAYWVFVNEAAGRNFFEGKYWTYNSGKAYERIFPFWKDKAIRSKLKNLINVGLITKSNFNLNVYDHTNWYTLTDYGKTLSRNWTIDWTKESNRVEEKFQSYNITSNSETNTTNNNTNNNLTKNNSIKDTVRPTETVERIIAEWNTLEKLGIVPVMKLTNGTKRKESLMARLKTYTEDDFIKAIENIRHSSFLQGSGNKGWVITFDWFVKPNNFPKVLEGNYNDTKPQPPKYENKPQDEVYKQTEEELAEAKAWWDSLEDESDV